MLHTPLLIVAQ